MVEGPGHWEQVHACRLRGNEKALRHASAVVLHRHKNTYTANTDYFSASTLRSTKQHHVSDDATRRRQRPPAVVGSIPRLQVIER